MSDTNIKPRHARIVTTKQLNDQTTEITTESYTDKLSSHKVETAQNIKTSRSTILGDLTGCLDVITKGETRELTIKITADRSKQPELIVKTWTVTREYYGK